MFDTPMMAADILAVLPHRFPFLLLDRVLTLTGPTNPGSRQGQTITALKNVTVNEPFFPGHFPGMPIMPGVLQIEAMAQAACMAYVRPSDVKLDFFIASIQDAKFRRPVVPGDQLILKAEVVRDRGQMIQVKTEALVDGQVVAEALILAKISPALGKGKVP